jgi:two-component system response regulator AtoC
VLQIDVPPLRERREDIGLLIDYFIERNNARLGTDIRRMHPDVRRLLSEYGWPGNVRELENTLERAMVLTDGDVLLTGDLPDRIHQARDPIRLHLRSDELSIKKTSRIVEEELIRRALQKTGGNRTHAAKLLEISHRALLYKIKDYEIEL